MTMLKMRCFLDDTMIFMCDESVTLSDQDLVNLLFAIKDKITDQESGIFNINAQTNEKIKINIIFQKLKLTEQPP